jgi:hypothetical protein
MSPRGWLDLERRRFRHSACFILALGKVLRSPTLREFNAEIGGSGFRGLDPRRLRPLFSVGVGLGLHPGLQHRDPLLEGLTAGRRLLGPAALGLGAQLGSPSGRPAQPAGGGEQVGVANALRVCHGRRRIFCVFHSRMRSSTLRELDAESLEFSVARLSPNPVPQWQTHDTLGAHEAGYRNDLTLLVTPCLRVAGGGRHHIGAVDDRSHHSADDVSRPLHGSREVRDLSELHAAHPALVEVGVLGDHSGNAARGLKHTPIVEMDGVGCKVNKVHHFIFPYWAFSQSPSDVRPQALLMTRTSYETALSLNRLRGP